MAADLKLTITPLNSTNYATWKLQCRMALMKEGLWTIVNGTEVPPPATETDKVAKFMVKKNRALATIVLAIEPSLLYIVGDPTDPSDVWTKLSNQFEKRTWANKLELRRKLHMLRLNEGDSVQDHIKEMTEIFDALSVIGAPVDEEDRVVYLLASLPDSYGMLVTALEANADVPKMDVVTERLLHEERKSKERTGINGSRNEAMVGRNQARKGPRCHFCSRYGHIKRNCWDFAKSRGSSTRPGEKTTAGAVKVNKTEVRDRDINKSKSMLVCSAMSACSDARGRWIVDSGATCHMCNDDMLFDKIHSLKEPSEVLLGDSHVLRAKGRGSVVVNMNLPDGDVECTLNDVLYVPELSYNLLSVSRASETGKDITFTTTGCQIFDETQELMAEGTKIGNLFYLNCQPVSMSSGLVAADLSQKDIVWHKRFGHLGEKNLQKLANDKLVKEFDYDASKPIGLCEHCIAGKQHREKFPCESKRESVELLSLVHSDVCGKFSVSSNGGAVYFLTFIDDKTRYVWFYVLKRKDQVFECFREWKAMVEKDSGCKLKVLRTDNGGEYTSDAFEKFLRSEGVVHQVTVPKSPEQNGVSERYNRTIVETVRSMLQDAMLPLRFWAEALGTAVYLRNRSPTTAVEGMTPFEAWTGRKPNVGHLRVFGCIAYAHVPKDERTKFESKTRKCVFLGYGTRTKGYRLYDPRRRKVFFSRDVVFDESRTWFFEKEVSPDSGGSVEIDYSDDVGPVSEEEVPELRRSLRIVKPPDYFINESYAVHADVLKDPVTVKEALSSSDGDRWNTAMEKEIESLKTNDVWDLVDLPEHRTPVGSKWVFKRKMNANGTVDRYKARLVAQGYSQKYGIDYDETFCPVVRFDSVRTLIALCVKNDLVMHQMDVTTAFLNGELKEEIYMKQPENFVEKGKEHLVCKLKRSIYGLKQSPRCWNNVLDAFLKELGFEQTHADLCLYASSEGEMCFIAVYVDDLIIACKDECKIANLKRAFAERFDMKDMGVLNHFLGIQVVQDKKRQSTWIGQSGYITEILKRFGMEDCHPVKTPVDSNAKLVKGDAGNTIDKRKYQSAVGSLMFLSVGTRPDISFAVNTAAKFCEAPTDSHWKAVKRIFRYLKGTVDLGLLYKRDAEHCIGFSDADWAGDVNDRKSTSGYLFKLSGAPITWMSKKQTCVALSSAEAEYVALASAVQEAVWIRQLCSDLMSKITEPLVIYEDNQSAICIAKQSSSHGRTKHIDIKYRFIENEVGKRIELKYCCTKDMLADILTKGLSAEQFGKLRSMIGICSIESCD